MTIAPIDDLPYRELGLRDDEYARIKTILGRQPTESELAMYSIMWSEHCSYKSSKVHLRQFGEKAPQLSIIGVDCYAGMQCAKALVEKAKSTKADALMTASEGLTFNTATGPVTMHNRHLDKSMYLAQCEGTTFKVIKTFENVKSGETCKQA